MTMIILYRSPLVSHDGGDGNLSVPPSTGPCVPSSAGLSVPPSIGPSVSLSAGPSVSPSVGPSVPLSAGPSMPSGSCPHVIDLANEFAWADT